MPLRPGVDSPILGNGSPSAFQDGMSHSGFKDLLRKDGFQAFLWTQFLGAFNDNVYKIIVSMRAVHVAATTGGDSSYLSLAGVVFVLPFLLFSGYAGISPTQSASGAYSSA